MARISNFEKEAARGNRRIARTIRKTKNRYCSELADLKTVAFLNRLAFMGNPPGIKTLSFKVPDNKIFGIGKKPTKKKLRYFLRLPIVKKPALYDYSNY